MINKQSTKIYSDTLSLLMAARMLISEPKSWTQDAFARTGDLNSNSIGPAERGAKCWCSIGAIRAFGEVCGGVPAIMSEQYLYDQVPLAGHRVDHFNDRGATRHADVLAMYDRAILQCEADMS